MNFEPPLIKKTTQTKNYFKTYEKTDTSVNI
jgi:hypothetical protein